MSTHADLQDYIDLFGCEPVEVDEAGWSYGVRFLVQDGDDALALMIAPDELQLDLLWTQRGVRRLKIGLRMVGGWQIEQRGESHHLLVRVNTGPTALCGFEFCLVRIRPSIEVGCRMMWGPGWAPSDTSAQPTTIPPFA